MGSKLVVRLRWRRVRAIADKIIASFSGGIEAPLRESGMRAGVSIGRRRRRRDIEIGQTI